MAIPVILKGETPKPIPLALKEGYDYSGCCLHVEFCGLQDTFINLEAGGRVDLRYTAEQTAVLPLGTSKVMLSLENANGEVRLMPWAKIKVTDSPADLYDGVITIDPATLNVDDLTAKDSLGAVKTKLQAVIDFLRGLKVLAVCALPFFALADVAPLYTTPNDMPGDAPLMTNTAAYVDAKVAAIPAPDYSTNNTALVETIEATAPAPGNYAAVSNAAVYAAITNALQDAVIAGKASKADATLTERSPTPWVCVPAEVEWYGGMEPVDTPYWDDDERAWYVDAVAGGIQRLSTDQNATTLTYRSWGATVIATRTVLQGYQLGSQTDKPLASEAEAEALRNGKQDKLPYPTNSIPYAAITGKPNLATVATSGSYNDLSNKPTIPTVPTNVSAFNNDAGYLTSYTESDPTVSSWAKQPTKPTYTADEVGAVSSNKIEEVRTDNAQTRQIVTTWENFLDGSNVVFSITNYLSGSYNLDAAKLKILELRDGEYHEVYNSRDEILLHIDDFSNRYVRVAINAIVEEVAARLASKADKDWGKYTSAGGEAPSNTVYMTAPNTVFAGGLEYERVAVGEGTICVLTTRGAPVWTQGDEGTFKFQDDGGTNYFGFAKTDSYTIGANTDGITVQGGMVTMNYNITMSGRPCVWYKSSLSSGAWEQLNLPDGSPVAGASHAVTWEANPDPGTQVCYINVGNAPSGFFRATVEVTGEAKFMTNMPADMSGGIVCPNTATGVSGIIKPTFDGTSVIWTWSAK